MIVIGIISIVLLSVIIVILLSIYGVQIKILDRLKRTPQQDEELKQKIFDTLNSAVEKVGNIV